MGEFPILRDLGYVIVGSAALLFATRVVRLPPLLVYMIGGLLLGPVAGLLTVSESLELFSELGVALLLFLVGLELSVERIRDVGRSALVGGAVQVLGTFVLGTAIALGLGFSRGTSVFLGLAVTFSSTVVVVKLLDRAGDLSALHGRISIGILLVQDVLVAVALTVVGGLGGAGETGAASVGVGLARSFLGMLALVLGAAAGVRWILPTVLAWLADSAEALFIASLTWCLGFIVAAEALHVSIELGAFVAGLALAQLHYSRELRRRVHPLVDFFLAVFFVALGAGMDLRAAAAHWVPALALSAFVLLGKPALVAGILARLGHSGRTAALGGITLGQISEFSFILGGLAAGAGLLEPEALSLVGLVGLVTIGGSAVLVPRGEWILRGLERRSLLRLLGGGPPEEPAAAPPAGHVVVVGMNGLGRRLVRELAARGERVVAVDTDPDKLVGLPAETAFGNIDSLSVLEEAGVARAKLVVSALQIEDVNALLAHRCRELGVPVSIHAFDSVVVHELLEIGADHLIVSKQEGIRQMAAELRERGVLG